MAESGSEWSRAERLTLRLSGVWIVSALVGRTRFDADEQDAYWTAVADVALRSEGVSRQVLESMAAERRWLFDEFTLDERSVVSGLSAVVRLLERVEPRDARRVVETLLAVGRQFATLRGPFGRRMTTEDEQTLLLVEQLLQLETDYLGDNPMNSHLPI